MLGEFSPTSNTYYLLGLDVLGQQQNNTWRYFGYDGLGSLRQMTNAGGFVAHSATYQPFGSLIEEFGASPSPGFTGEMQDPTGLMYLRARYMDPVTGTFLSKDPVIGVTGFSQTWNPYSYARNNPINLIDPSGRFSFGEALGFAAGIVAASAVATVGVMALIGTAPILGAIALGAGLAMGMEVIFQLMEGKGKCPLDAGRLLKAGMVGAAAGGVAAMIPTVLVGMGMATGEAAAAMSLPMRVAVQLGVGALSGVVGGQTARLTGNVLNNQPLNANGVGDVATMGLDGTIGAVATGVMQLGGWAAGNLRAWWTGDVPEPTTQAAQGGCLPNSFSAATLVLTAKGLKPIFEVAIGDEVIGYVAATGETGEYTVIDTIHHTDPEIVLLTIDDEVLETTAEHPFYTDDGVWVNAAALEVGEQVYSFSGDYGTVESVEVVTISQEMYNLTVDEAHTFFVGEGNWLVHNQEGSAPPNPWSQNAAWAFGDDVRWGNYWNFMSSGSQSINGWYGDADAPFIYQPQPFVQPITTNTAPQGLTVRRFVGAVEYSNALKNGISIGQSYAGKEGVNIPTTHTNTPLSESWAKNNLGAENATHYLDIDVICPHPLDHCE